MRNMIKILSFLSLFIIFVSCGNGTITGNPGGTTVTTGLKFTTVADFESSASASVNALVKMATTGVCEDLEEPISSDDPVLTDGLDCDEDGGVVAHLTPEQYSLALKRITMVATDGEDVDLIEDTGTLAESQIIDFTPEDPEQTIIEIDAEDLIGGTYSGLEFEIYYFQMTFNVAGEERNVRFYMSDDDFDNEGNLGHHQGDVTFVDGDDVELGWIDSTWTDTFETREEAGQEGAGDTDPETGHERGFFGNVAQWDADDQMQGADQDLYLMDLPFSLPVPIPEPAENQELITLTATFSVADTFFYEDFDNTTLENCTGFCPEEGAEAGLEEAEWAPVLPTAEIEVTTEDAL